MATLQASSFLNSSCNFTTSSSSSRRRTITAKINIPNFGTKKIFLARLISDHEQFTSSSIEEVVLSPSRILSDTNVVDDPDLLVIEKLYAIKEAVADRVEMHRNIEEQRSQWNSMLLTSINGITLAAATMAGIAGSSSGGDSVLGLKMSSTLMYLAATGMLTIMNQIQPSQLAEEQRNATRLFQDLHNQIETTLSIGHPSDTDVKEAMDKVLALDKAYPLPLLGVMLEKFPSSVEPAVWWPQQRRRQNKRVNDNLNGWNGKLEEEMREIMGVLGRKDQEEYIRLGEKALKMNKFLAISGPLLTGVAAIGSMFIESNTASHGFNWAAMLGIVGGALASVVNTIEHGVQVGMVFEMYRSNAGFFEYMKEAIESNLTETELERRENGEVFELKLAMKLGRSLSDLRNLAAASSLKEERLDEFASKLF